MLTNNMRLVETYKRRLSVSESIYNNKFETKGMKNDLKLAIATVIKNQVWKEVRARVRVQRFLMRFYRQLARTRLSTDMILPRLTRLSPSTKRT